MDILNTGCKPCLDGDAIECNLRGLLVPGKLRDRDLDRRIDRLEERFRVYAGCYPHGVWGPGLAIDREMRSLTELYLPMEEISRAFGRLFSMALLFPPFRKGSLIHASGSWLDFLCRIRPPLPSADPATLLSHLMEDEAARCRFLFANFIPSSYGGVFGRYPLQERFLADWLEGNRARLSAGVRCLDAACGAGEGTYGLLRLVLENGFARDAVKILGTTVEPLERFAAVHACFPHDPSREQRYRQWIGKLVAVGAVDRIRFALEDLREPLPSGGEVFDIILCNGVLGGPFFHDEGELRVVVGRLASRLAPKGILLAASRFHDGWKRMIEGDLLSRIFVDSGLRPLQTGEGVGGERP